MRWAATIVLYSFLAVGSPRNQHSIRMSGNDLARSCSKEPGSFDNGLCVGYISGVADGLKDELCLPADIKTTELVNTTVKYMNETPRLLHLDARSIVWFALQRDCSHIRK